MEAIMIPNINVESTRGDKCFQVLMWRVSLNTWPSWNSNVGNTILSVHASPHKGSYYLWDHPIHQPNMVLFPSGGNSMAIFVFLTLAFYWLEMKVLLDGTDNWICACKQSLSADP